MLEIIHKGDPCFYCGEPIKWAVHRLDPGGYNLDRIDNDLGYSIDNVVVACVVCNRARGNVFTHEEFKKIGPVIAAIREECRKSIG